MNDPWPTILFCSVIGNIVLALLLWCTLADLYVVRREYRDLAKEFEDDRDEADSWKKGDKL